MDWLVPALWPRIDVHCRSVWRAASGREETNVEQIRPDYRLCTAFAVISRKRWLERKVAGFPFIHLLLFPLVVMMVELHAALLRCHKLH